MRFPCIPRVSQRAPVHEPARGPAAGPLPARRVPLRPRRTPAGSRARRERGFRCHRPRSATALNSPPSFTTASGTEMRTPSGPPAARRPLRPRSGQTRPTLQRHDLRAPRACSPTHRKPRLRFASRPGHLRTLTARSKPEAYSPGLGLGNRRGSTHGKYGVKRRAVMTLGALATFLAACTCRSVDGSPQGYPNLCGDPVLCGAGRSRVQHFRRPSRLPAPVRSSVGTPLPAHSVQRRVDRA